jgi:hypothetical protein
MSLANVVLLGIAWAAIILVLVVSNHEAKKSAPKLRRYDKNDWWHWRR